ncbi:MAG: retron St85 family RNA-directed DNA polymerase [Ramlibacter sp.]|nr:retron St85 family RNA-directed DNA polymerase [Ramlibacter sp.]
MTELERLLSAQLMIPLEEIQHAIRYAPTRHRRFYIKKRTGGSREIIQPSVKIKPVLSWLNANVFSKLPVHGIATAFRRDRSILDNAIAHSESRYAVRVDVENFFPSIRASDLVYALTQSKDFLPAWIFDPVTLRTIASICFDGNSRLPIGYSTSPAIANAVMYKIDNEVAATVAKEADFGKGVITRYADDFVFSTDRVGACNLFVHALGEIFKLNTQPALLINKDKTRFMSRGGGSLLVTGLRVNNAGNVVVHSNYRDHVRLLLKLYSEGNLNNDEFPKLEGHLAYVQQVDPALFTKLSVRYYKEISQLRAKS